MDELPETTSSPSSALPTTNRRDTLQSLLTTGRPYSPHTALSNSEPSLRFPRPQGNRRLANWISTSNPDMLDVTTGTEESALAESSYELITPVGNDLQDDQYTASISESVGSLEFQRPDDVHSLTGTEHTYDDESIVDDDAEPLSRSMMHEEAVDVHNGDHASIQERPDDWETDSEEESYSRSSLEHTQHRLEYAQHSLETPSIMTPEASKLDAREGPTKYMSTSVHDATSRFWDYAAGAISAVLPAFMFATLFMLLINLLYPSPVPFTNDPRPVVTSTMAATTTPVAIYTSCATSAATPVKQSSTSVKGTGLIVVHDKASDDWLFGSRKPDMQLTPLGQGAITVHVASDVTQAWLKRRDCLSITAERDAKSVIMTYLQSPDGFVVKFPKNETHGVVKLTIQATCRPSVVKAVEIHFGKGLMEEAYEMTKNLASDISGLVPVAAHEAEKCLVGAKKSFSAMSGTVASSVLVASDNLLCRIKDSAYKMQELVGEKQSSLGPGAQDVIAKLPLILASIRKQLTEPLKAAPSLKTSMAESILRAQLHLVTTQISAKMWWLSITGQRDRHDEYGQKARTYMDSLRAKRRNSIHKLQLHRARNHTCSLWSKRSRCKKHERKG
ncbi:hypothetical protein E4U41_002100 [Claviceps citrina]|nr:hypothetical protein E4U41_002100 [Claviceps citrina]